MSQGDELLRRDFLRQTVVGAALAGFFSPFGDTKTAAGAFAANDTEHTMTPNMIGAYGEWAAKIVGDGPAKLSFLQPRFEDVDAWRAEAKRRVWECLAPPEVGPIADVRIDEAFEYDDVAIERVSWQLPYGPRTKAVVLKPANISGKLRAVLALHDHGGNKYFGHEKLIRTGANDHPVILKAQEQYYGGVGWANELAKRGYVVLVHDAFAFGSRKVRLQDVAPGALQGAQPLEDDGSEAFIHAYNRWAGSHESLMAKSLLCAGTTWPGVFLTEDQRALDYLCSRPDVDANQVGCAGLSGGGLRTVYLGGLDERIRCACCVGMMTTWRDYLLNKCHTHTWMIYIPHLPRDLDYPEILSLRAPAATLVQNDREDQLFTLPEMMRADAMLRAVFKKAGAADKYRGTFYPGPHKFDLPMQAEAFEWFDQWLKG